MTTIVTLGAGQQQTINMKEGDALNIIGAANSLGVVYHLNDALGGTNSLQSWQVGAGALPAIGPYPGTSRFLLTCAMGSMAAAVSDAVLSLSGAGVSASITPAIPVVGVASVATLPPGSTGTLQFTLTSAAGVKSNVGNPSAAGSKSLSYTPTLSDVGTLGIDVSNVVTSTLGGTLAIQPPQATLRQVASGGTFLNDTLITANKHVGSRSPFIAGTDMSVIRVVLTNWYIAGSITETNAPGNMTGWIGTEYPLGSPVHGATFGGNVSGTAVPGAELETDDIVLPQMIPKGAEAAIWLYLYCPSGIMCMQRYSNDGNAQLSVDDGTSNLIPNLALNGSTGSYTNAVGARNGFMTVPQAIIALSPVEATGLPGDSISVGTNDTVPANSPNQGHLGRAFKGMPYGHLGTYGDTIQAFLAGSSKRVAFAKKYFTRFACHMGINDLSGGRTAEQVGADTNSMALLYSPAKMAMCTLMPVTASTDAWVSTANQTVAANAAVRAAVNNQRLTPSTLAANIATVWDVTQAIENMPAPSEDGKWKAPGYTADGTHPENIGYAAAATSINAAAFVAL